MPDKREYYLGARFTENEKKYIKNFAEKININVSDLLREAIFSHIDFLKNNQGKLEKIEAYLLTEIK